MLCHLILLYVLDVLEKETQYGIIHHNEVCVCVDAPRNDCEWWYGDELFQKIKKLDGSGRTRIVVCHRCSSPEHIHIYQMMYIFVVL